MCSSDKNYIYLIELMTKKIKKYNVKVVAYCLMPNHYHFLISTVDKIQISKYIQSCFNSYVQAFNKQQSRKGPLFESKVKIKIIDKEEYLIHICRYIHLNPVKAKLVKNIEDWKFSNYLEWIAKRKSILFDSEFFDTYFKNPADYKEFALSRIEYLDGIDKYL